MIRKQTKTLILFSLLTLLPILVGLILWDRFPEQMTTHWGLDGQPDGWGSVPFAVFFPPLAMLAGLWLCIWVTARDPGNKDRNRKPLSLVLWIIPIASNLCSGVMYALALGADFSPERILFCVLGLMFAAIGNYLPKCRTNSTMGIKIPWAYTSEENWNATHRMAGKLWLPGGLLIAFCSLLPGAIATVVVITILIAMIAAPTLYSWRYYRRQKAQGVALAAFPKPVTKAEKFSVMFLVLLLLGVGILMFSGELDYQFGEDCFTIEASFYSDLTVDYAAIDHLELRQGNVPGTQVGGWDSARLLLGFFRNEELGNYTRYTYVSPDACIVLTAGEKTLVLSGKNASETEQIYNALLQKLEK